MRWKSQNIYEWHRVFALLPKYTKGGTWVWLEYVERSWSGGLYGSWDYRVPTTSQPSQGAKS